MKPPKVSVCITTYNHGKFIAQALDSVLAQKTNFEVEIIVGEDDSDDRTRDIVKEYAEIHPEKIRLLLNDRSNVIYIGGFPTGRWNFTNNLKYAKGEFVALLEGDDYWIDESKLQRQVDQLEAHPECSFSFHNAWTEDSSTREMSIFPGLAGSSCPIDALVNAKLDENVEVRIQDLFFRWVAPTASIVFRLSKLDEFPEWYYKCISGDHTLQLWLARNGNAIFLNRFMSVWRQHPGGLSRHCTGVFHKRNWARMHHEFNRHFTHEYDNELAHVLAREFEQTSDIRVQGNKNPAVAFKDLMLSISYYNRVGQYSLRKKGHQVFRWFIFFAKAGVVKLRQWLLWLTNVLSVKKN